MSDDLHLSLPDSTASLPPRRSEADPQTIALMRSWLLGLVKTLKSTRLYAANSELLQRFLSDTHQGLGQLLQTQPELSLLVREDRLVFLGEDVLINPDREEGLPYVLYRNAFRRITFHQGWSRDDVLEFLLALNKEIVERDPTTDLVSLFWALSIPALSYVTIDSVLSASDTTTDEVERREVEDLQQEIEGILSHIYQTTATDDDLVQNLNIDQLDLQALQATAHDTGDLDLLDKTTARAIMGIATADLERTVEVGRAELEHGAVFRRGAHIFVDLLGRAREPRDSVATANVILQLADKFLEEQDFDFVFALVEHLRSPRLFEQPGARYVLDQLTSQSRLGVLLDSMSESSSSVIFTKVVDLIGVLGAAAVPRCLDALVHFTEPAQRRALIDLLLQIGISDPKLILSRFGESEWFVDRDLLALAQSLPAEHQAAVVLRGLEHENPRVRTAAVAQLRGFRQGTADRLLAGMLSDPDLDVCLAAIRVAAARKSQPCLPALREMIAAPEFPEFDPRLIRLATLAYGRLAGDLALPVLEGLMHPGLFKSFKSMDAQLAAVVAIGAVGTPASGDVLRRGAKSLNKAIREACKKALLEGARAPEDLES